MKKVFIYIMLALNLFALEGSVGLGTINALDKYTGEEKTLILPVLNLKYNDFYFRGTEFGYAKKIEKIEMGSSLRLSIGGDLKPEDVDYKILEKREAPVYLSFYAKNKISKNGNVEFKYQKEFQSKGDIISVSYSQKIPLKLPLLFIPYIRYSLVDGDYTNYYLGLRPSEVIYWGEDYETYKNSSKFDYGFTSLLFLTKKISLSLIYNKESLDNNHSKIVRSSVNSVFIASLLYKF